ncbi:hypothetical protein GCM10025785_17690 [Corynebacterium canis]
MNHSLTSSFIACNRGYSDANIHDTFCEYNEATIVWVNWPTYELSATFTQSSQKQPLMLHIQGVD